MDDDKLTQRDLLLVESFFKLNALIEILVEKNIINIDDLKERSKNISENLFKNVE